MTRRLVFLMLASFASYAGLSLIYQSYFSDIVPVASSEGAQSLWRFEAAFVLTAIMWISLAVALLATIFITVLLIQQIRRTGSRETHSPLPRRKVPGSGLR